MLHFAGEVLINTKFFKDFHWNWHFFTDEITGINPLMNQLIFLEYVLQSFQPVFDCNINRTSLAETVRWNSHSRLNTAEHNITLYLLVCNQWDVSYLCPRNVDLLHTWSVKEKEKPILRHSITFGILIASLIIQCEQFRARLKNQTLNLNHYKLIEWFPKL